jgi:hypothetical protein
MGKKVRLTPTNRIINCLTLKILLIENPIKIGHQDVRPTIMVNTAPILST